MCSVRSALRKFVIHNIEKAPSRCQFILHIDYLGADDQHDVICKSLCGEKLLLSSYDNLHSYNSVFLHSIPYIRNSKGIRDLVYLKNKYKGSIFCEVCLEEIRNKRI